MLKALTPVQIDRLASRPGVRRGDVENFLMSMHHGDTDAHSSYENARMDARSYGWNDATLGAIVDGIALSASEKAADEHKDFIDAITSRSI